MTRIAFIARVERHDAKLPRYLVIPRRLLASHGIRERVTVSGALGGVRFERRSVHPWDDERFFMNLPQRLCERARVDVGDSVEVVLEPPADDVPTELAEALAAEPVARRAWQRLSPSRRRTEAAAVADAVRPETRRRRTERLVQRLAR